jgi:Meiotically up-regulated gene 113
MLKSKLNSLTKTLENLLMEMSEKDILDLSKNDNGVFNVVVGLHKESFSTIVWNDEKANFDYYLIYITKMNQKLEGYLIQLQPLKKNRNVLTNIFSNFIANKYNKNEEETMGVFNAFQDQQRTVFERKEYLTFGDEIKDEIKNSKSSLIVKGNKMPLYVPFARKQEIVKLDKTKQQKEENENFVYLMHNKSNGYYKIGRSIKPEHREKTLQAQEPDVILIEKWMAPAEIERLLHQKYKQKRKRGEWFELIENDIEEIKIFMLEIISRKITNRKKK